MLERNVLVDYQFFQKIPQWFTIPTETCHPGKVSTISTIIGRNEHADQKLSFTAPCHKKVEVG